MTDAGLICFAVKEEAEPFVQRRPAGVKVLLTGMGRQNAEATLRAELARREPRWVMTCGFAVGLNPNFSRGTVIYEADPGFPLTTELIYAGAEAARFLCSPQVVNTLTEKQILRQTTRADAVEMESGAIRAICNEHGIASATVRVISDAAHENMPLDFNRMMTAHMRINYLKLIGALLRAPAKIGPLIQFQRQTRAAARQLAEVLLKAVL